MFIPIDQLAATKQRMAESAVARARAERLSDEGRHLDIDEPQRVHKWLVRRGLSPVEATAVQRESLTAAALGETTNTLREDFGLERVLGTNDLMGVAFLARGLQVARTVGRIVVGGAAGRPAGYGTGFLVGPRLLLTNHHVLGEIGVARSSFVEFDYEINVAGQLQTPNMFALAPQELFWANRELDFALVAVAEAGANGRRLEDLGWNPVSAQQGKVIVGQFVNIIQHPNGEPKQLCLRDNQIVALLDDFLHYKTDTAPGSSGSPVLNERWEVVGLHHSGIWDTDKKTGQPLAIDGRVWTPDMGEHRLKWTANEGVRISRIIDAVRNASLNAAARRLADQLGATPPALSISPAPAGGDGSGGGGFNGAGFGGDGGRRGGEAVHCEHGPDGVARWTIPLVITAQLGCGIAAPAPLATVQPSTTGPRIDATPTDERSIVEAARRDLAGRGDVIDVRLGYRYRNGWITKERALVVKVRQKQSRAELGRAGASALPPSFLGLPLEVSGPSIRDLLALQSATLPGAAEMLRAETDIRAAEITYTAPDALHERLQQVYEGPMSVVAHVSPDVGWPQLESFLDADCQRLVVGMYDLGAPHVIDKLKSLAGKAGFQQLSLVMQHGASVGSGTKKFDLHDEDAVAALEEALGNRFENAWVKIGTVNGWVASSYHVKIAVRDGKTFWLSSGNLQSSNQPKANPLHENPQRAFWLERHNREWHVICEHAGLAEVFRDFIRHDFQNNQAGAEEMAAAPQLAFPAALWPRPLEALANFQYFPPSPADKRHYRVRPLLTPDNYLEHVLDLVAGAEKELLIQNQTFNAPKPNQEELTQLMEAILERQQAGVDVKIIFRNFHPADVKDNLDALQDFGFNTDQIKVFPTCHTKGIVVDRRRVLVGSQNLSSHGVSVNRDASLLFDDEPLAQYFATIFDHDWTNLARQFVGHETMPFEVLAPGAPVPAGYAVMDWNDYLETL